MKQKERDIGSLDKTSKPSQTIEWDQLPVKTEAADHVSGNLFARHKEGRRSVMRLQWTQAKALRKLMNRIWDRNRDKQVDLLHKIV
jgi:hypothetical protein